MQEIFRELVHRLGACQPAVLVSILSSSGSTPRGIGAMMAVFPDGSAAGTIGGGNVEFEAQKLAGQLLKTGENDSRSFHFAQGNSQNLGMVCGGDVTLHFQCLPSGDVQSAAVFRRLTEDSGKGEGAWLIRKLDGNRVMEMRVAETDERNGSYAPLLKQQPVFTQDGWFSVPVVRPGWAYIFGGGHVAQALVPVIARVGFHPVVYDDRLEFTDPDLFPQACRTVCCNFTRLSEKLTLTSDDYAVVMTRGHQSDYEVLVQILRSGAKYIGCIGSQKKLSICKDLLLKAGFTEEEYCAVYAPIGLPIGARTPEEIAVSVAAQMIAVRAGIKK